MPSLKTLSSGDVTLMVFVCFGLVQSQIWKSSMFIWITLTPTLNYLWNTVKIILLSLTLFKDDHGALHTSVFRKPTDRNTILHARSFHPKWLKENVPYGQFQRVRRICDLDNSFECKAKEMTSRFKERGYKNTTLQEAYSRAKSANRISLLEEIHLNQQKIDPFLLPHIVQRQTRLRE